MKWVDHEYYLIGKFFRWVEQCIERSLERGDAKRYWHSWFAWRPVSIPEAEHRSIVVKRHYVWLERVDRRRINPVWREYRSRTLDPGQYERSVHVGNGKFENRVMTLSEIYG